MDPILTYARSKQNQVVSFLHELVECESPSDDPAAVNRFVELLSDRLSTYCKLRTVSGGARFGKHLLCEFTLPGKGKSGQILALGHSDTVWPVGTLRQMPAKIEQDKLHGPGVFDMKAGIALFVFAMRALRELDLPVSRKVLLQLNSDEEVGSDSSRPLTEKHASASVAVLVLEPPAGPQGKVKTARKGVGSYTVKVQGVPAHAGLDFASGASAIVEMARQIEVIAALTRLEKGITVNPGIISGGTRSNVIAAEAETVVDFRIPRASDAKGLDRSFHCLRPFDPRCRVEVIGGLNRPPLERTPGVVKLFRTAQKIARQLGFDLEETAVGGGSDGNFTAGLGIPTLDGLGAIGDGAHASHEHIVIEHLPERMALLAHMVRSL
jgi:glutamate carboxypeptidase